MSEDEFNAAMAGARQAQSGLGGVPGGLGAGNVCTPSTTLTGAANGQSINGLLSEFSSAQVPLGGGYAQAGRQPAYGEQCADTDGLAAIQTRDAAWVRAVQNARLVSDWHEDEANPRETPTEREANQFGMIQWLETQVAELQARIARKEAANEALVAKLEATMADMRSLQRQAHNWRAECQRLSALLVEMQQELARRMAMPGNALRHGGVR